jgi:hypothetical protein
MLYRLRRRLIPVQQQTLLFVVVVVVVLASNDLTFNNWRRSSTTIFCHAQETPTLTLEYFNYSTSYRQNVCQRQVQLDNSNGTLQLRDALAGLELSTFLYLDNRYVKIDNNSANATTKALNAVDDDPGLIAVLLDELAARAAFQWRNSFGVIENVVLPKDKTYSDLLSWSVSSYDISAAYWQKTLQRMQQGASFPEGWYDATLIMIAVESDEDSGGGGGANNLDLWGFLAPFSTSVWIMILVTIVVSAMTYWFLDWYDTATDVMNLDHEPAQNLFLAAMTFTGNFEFQPSSNPARIFSVSMAFFSLIVMSSYTGTKSKTPPLTVYMKWTPPVLERASSKFSMNHVQFSRENCLLPMLCDVFFVDLYSQLGQLSCRAQYTGDSNQYIE